MNIEKTQAIWLGSKRKSQVKYCPELKMDWNPSEFKILGIWLSVELANVTDINYTSKQSEIDAFLKRLDS